MKSINFIIAVLFLCLSCSTENEIPEESFEAIEAVQATIILPQNPPADSPPDCDGYGIFEDKQYDCGWKRGYGDWVYHYNWVASNYDLPSCYKYEIKEVKDRNGNFLGVRILGGSSHYTAMLIQEVQNTFQSYYEALFENSEGSWNQGKIAGYLAGRGQQPYAGTSSEACPKVNLPDLEYDHTPRTDEGWGEN